VKFYVKDSGIGIHPDNLEMIFERFTQIEDVNNKQYEGTGLGLSISKSILNLLGGRIWVESVLGYGSVFYFEIPLSESYTIKPTEKSIPGLHLDNKSLNGKKLLVAEDVDYNFILLREALKTLNMEIFHANNGLEAVDILSKNPDISIVLMDMRMPVMDGYEATPIIKKMNSEIKVIATTAYALTGEREKCLSVGCDYYISKPINIKLLIENIEEIIDKPLNIISLETAS
jgi:CheY-like chemotaxis protein